MFANRAKKRIRSQGGSSRSHVSLTYSNKRGSQHSEVTDRDDITVCSDVSGKRRSKDSGNDTTFSKLDSRDKEGSIHDVKDQSFSSIFDLDKLQKIKEQVKAMVPIYPEGIVEQNKKLSLDYNEMKYNYTSLTTNYRMLKLTSERKLEKLQNQVNEKEYCINQLKQQITEKQNNNEKLQEQINELKKQVESLQEKVNSNNDKIIMDQLKDEIISLKHTISILEIQLKESQQNIELLNLQLNNKDKEFKEQINNLETQLISKEEEITKLMRLNLKLEKNQNTQVDSNDPKTLELVIKEYQVLKEQHNKLEQQYILLKKEKEFINYSQSQHLLLKESCLSLENRIKRKQDYIEEMEKTLATVNSKSIEWANCFNTGELDSINSLWEAYQNEKDKNQQQMNFNLEVNIEMKQKEEEYQKLLLKVNELESKNQNLTDKVNQSQAEIIVKDENIMELKEEVEKFKCLIDNQLLEKSKLRDQESQFKYN